MNLYVINATDDMIYEVKHVDTQYKGMNSYSTYSLYLVAGMEYINPDYSDQQGWVGPDRFVDDVQYDSIVHYFVTESLEDCLADNGYAIIDRLPQIY